MPEATSPAVSILMAVQDGWDATYRCLMSTLEHGGEVRCETIVMDDASTDETRLALPRLEGIVTARADTRVGRAKSLAAGLPLARGRYILFLSQFAEPKPGFLAPLLRALDDDPTLAAAGAVLLSPSGSVESAGIGIGYAAPLPITPFPLDQGEPPSAVRGGTVPALPGAACLVRAEALQNAGGLDDGYMEVFEDLDLSFRLLERGGRLRVVPESVVVLHESPGWEDLGRYEPDLVRLNRAWIGRFEAFTVDRRKSTAATPPRAGRPPLSIVIPMRNALASVATVLEDIGLNLGPKDEVVVSDAGSSDGTLEFANAFARDHPGIARVVQSRPEAGFAGAARAGLDAAQRSSVALVHTGVSLAPGFLDDATELLTRNANAQAIAIPVLASGTYVVGDRKLLRDVARDSADAFLADGTDDLAACFAKLGARLLVVNPDAPGPFHDRA